MTNTDTNDTEASVAQVERIAAAGGEIVRLTAQGRREAANLGRIRALLDNRGCRVPLVADIHFLPAAALVAAEQVEKVRINPGNWNERGGEFDELLVDMPPARSRAAHRRQPRFAVAFDHGTLRRHGRRHGRLGHGVFAPLPRGVVRTGRRLDQVEQRARDGAGLSDAGRRDASRGNALSAASGRYRGGRRPRGTRQVGRRHRSAALRRHRRHDPRLAHRGSRAGNSGRPDAGRLLRRPREPRADPRCGRVAVQPLRVPPPRVGRDGRHRGRPSARHCERDTRDGPLPAIRGPRRRYRLDSRRTGRAALDRQPQRRGRASGRSF